METKTKLDLNKIKNLIPAVLPEDRWERNGVMHSAQSIVYRALFDVQVENGGSKTMLDICTSDKLRTVVDNLARKAPSKWNDLVEIYFGEPLTGKHDAEHFAVRLIMNYKDMHMEQVREVIASEYPNEYEDFRKKNAEANHEDAMKHIATAHFHYYTWETTGERNHILGTHNLRTVFTCECGHSYETRSVNNYSGD